MNNTNNIIFFILFELYQIMNINRFFNKEVKNEIYKN
jgi:hypothetical protein